MWDVVGFVVGQYVGIGVVYVIGVVVVVCCGEVEVVYEVVLGDVVGVEQIVDVF